MTPRIAIDAVLFAVAAVPAAWAAWWALLALIALPRPHAAPPARRPWSLIVIIPAHNEEHTLPATLQSLAAASPRAAEVIVVADNCTDGTAEVAHRLGATVLVRNDPAARGKAFALDFTLASLRSRPVHPDGVVFLDADTVAAPDLFQRLTDRLDAGALVVQAYYQAAIGHSELSRLRRLAFSLIHWARPVGAARMGLGATLKGNGMAFRWDVIAQGSGGAGVTEDAAMTLDLVRRGIAVSFEPSARVTGLMADSYRDAATQDERWEGGRMALLRPAVAAFAAAVRAGNVRAAGAALEVAAPPLSFVGGLASLTAAVAWITRSSVAFSLASFALASLAVYVSVGLLAARPAPRDLAALLEAPRFLAHKLAVYARLARGGAPRQWERTLRAPREESR